MVNKYLRFIYSFFICVLGISCIDTPKDPILPRWDVELNLPLIKRTTFLDEILDTANNASVSILSAEEAADSLYVIMVDSLVTNSPITGNLKIPATITPTSLDMEGEADDGPVTSSIIFNPDRNYHIDTAYIKSGLFKIGLANFTVTNVDYEIILPGFRDPTNNQIVRTTGTIGPITPSGPTTVIIEFDVTDYRYAELPVIGLNDLNNFLFQAAPGFLVIGKATAPPGIDIDLRSGVSTENITFSKVVGQIARTTLDYITAGYSTGFGDDVRKFEDKIDFQKVSVSVRARTFGDIKNVKLILDSLTLTGYVKDFNNSLINPFGLTFSGNPFYRDSLIAGEPMVREFDETNSNIDRFLVKFPEEIGIGNRFILDKNSAAPGISQVVSDKDSIRLRADIVAPMILAARDAEYSTDVKIEITDDQRDDILSGQSASLTLEVENYVALGIRTSVAFLDVNSDTLFKVLNTDGTTVFNVAPSEVNSEGIPTQPGISVLTVELDATQIEMFSRAETVGATVSIRSTGSTSTAFGPYVRVRARDFVKYNLYGTVKYRVDVEDDNE